MGNYKQEVTGYKYNVLGFLIRRRPREMPFYYFSYTFFLQLQKCHVKRNYQKPPLISGIFYKNSEFLSYFLQHSFEPPLLSRHFLTCLSSQSSRPNPGSKKNMACFQLYLRRPVEEFEVKRIQETLIQNNTKLGMFIICSLIVIHSSIINAHLLIVNRFGSSGARMSKAHGPGVHSQVNKTWMALQLFFFLTE